MKFWFENSNFDAMDWHQWVEARPNVPEQDKILQGQRPLILVWAIDLRDLSRVVMNEKAWDRMPHAEKNDYFVVQTACLYSKSFDDENYLGWSIPNTVMERGRFSPSS
jgi:hypothetical protein